MRFMESETCFLRSLPAKFKSTPRGTAIGNKFVASSDLLVASVVSRAILKLLYRFELPTQTPKLSKV